ncbi:helix-turn-helix domain-containing protein [Bremerella sp.]|uniref:helix-turn-helix domain-containing protein n=1 Tax=Bremerella sp. TaxID=2795602 RepID=UPI0039196554
MKSSKYLSASELAEVAGISVATVWRLKGEGKIGFLQPGGRGSRVLFKCDALEHPPNSVTPGQEPVAAPKRPGPKLKWQK